MNILVTGGAGYIGSHCALALILQGHNVIILDDLSTGNLQAVKSLQKYGNVQFIHENIAYMSHISQYHIDAIIHFAASSQVGESVQNPCKYYVNNVCNTISLLNVMLQENINKIIFSSSAAVYKPSRKPLTEYDELHPVNPYGRTKLMIENILSDYSKAYGLQYVSLRYFNVVGANPNYHLGELHNPETHLVPNILKALCYNTPFNLYGDGSCIRDYVNVEDLARAHILALEYLYVNNHSEHFNIGTKTGNSVNEVIHICEKVTENNLTVNLCNKRPGDPEILVANNNKAKKLLHWEPKYTLEYSIRTAYEWEKQFMQKI